MERTLNVLLVLLGVGLVGCTSQVRGPEAYQGWSDSYTLMGENLEAVIVPSIGRLMDLRRPGETVGVLWQNPALLGQKVQPSQKAWTNFGGDKTWPAPESVWMKNDAGQWMPPTVFDQASLQVQSTRETLTLTSEVDPRSGVRFTRTFQITDANTLQVTTTYHKVQGPSIDIAVWIITQLRDPEIVGTFANPETPAYQELFGPTPRVTIEPPFLFWDRQQAIPAKIGTRGRSLVWVGKTHTLQINLQVDRSSSVYPDRGSSAEFYTSPDGLPYIELETVGPIVTLRPGESVQTTNEYHLGDRRTDESAKAAAKRLLKSAAYNQR